MYVVITVLLYDAVYSGSVESLDVCGAYFQYFVLIYLLVEYNNGILLFKRT